MAHRSMRECVADLKQAGHLVELVDQVDPDLDAAEIQRRVYRSGGPAILFSNVKGCQFPLVSNLFGDIERARYLFRDTIETVRKLIELKIDPQALMRNPLRYWKAPFAALSMLPKRINRAHRRREIRVSDLPQIKSWPDDGGAFITLPQVYSEDVAHPGVMKSNLGMYRIQISGNDYKPDAEIGLHYQIHRGIGVHQAAAIREGKPFRVNIFVGGTPAMTLAAVMPLPEGMTELSFAGALAGHRIPMVGPADELPIYADADFVIEGVIDPSRKLPEGPFGDHLGYYSLAHDFPVLQITRVTCREDAIWPFTVVGRPPQEDTTFGALIHELTGPVIPTVIPGVREVNAVDAAGVHPLLLAIGSERYTPYAPVEHPQELLTQANAILGQGQMSLAKYVLIVDEHDDPEIDTHHIDLFFQHLLRRVDWRRDLHFQTRTTIDTLDYSGSGFNQGSKVVIAACGPVKRKLPTEVSSQIKLPDGFHSPVVCMPGVIAISAPGFERSGVASAQRFADDVSLEDPINRFPLVVLTDDSEFTAATLNNFLWTVFTRSNPAADIYGVASQTIEKHWGCEGSLIIDARIKPHHAPPLIEDPEVTKRVDALAARGGPLARYL